MLKRPNVELVTQKVDHVEPNAIVAADGTRYEVDVIVMATGFQAARMLGPMEIYGRQGKRLRDSWGDDATAFSFKAGPPEGHATTAKVKLFPDWRHHAFITNTALAAVAADAFHRNHAIVELAIRDLKEGAGLEHCPSGHYSANAAWLACTVLARTISSRFSSTRS